ncbi:4-alpha-glucanotransferase [Prevotella sp. MA2016]|uniref:4-alpha-glucanotransferase n=1 Tax=Prevotella sp. MA2016 TaxID=1408310 RepID=UPI00048CEC24|nr:4-alpha-glucanotransferase [Prevotella sp. MA2016]
MKLKFSIQYGTQWGQNLYVVLTCFGIDQTKKTERLLMTTENGWEWSLETTVLESRKHPIASFSYHYQVEDADGNVLRKEWDAIPRTYFFDSAKNYVMADMWRDVPLQYHLYSRAYLTAEFLPAEEQVEPRRVPLYRKTVLFRVSAPQLQKGQAVAIIGSHPALGSWNVARYLRMEYMGRFEWQLSVNVDAVLLPLEYKYVIIEDETHAFVAWEEGDNRTTDGLLPADQSMVPDGTVLVAYGENLRVKERIWRVAGVVVPVFSLRSTQSYGVGDFGDLHRLVDWCVATGMKAIQLLPVNDTTCVGNWSDSYPYNIVSAFALHPHYLDVEAVGVLKSKDRMIAYHRQRQELNAISYSDYEAVDRVKHAYIEEVFAEKGKQTLEAKEFKAWHNKNRHWLEPYAKWLGGNYDLVCFTQYHLHVQLKNVADYARSKGVFLKGDVPIGVNGDSVETATHPDYFHLDAQTGAPPDAFSPNGQNWGFPTYNWGQGVVDWFHQRLKWMEQYFDAIRIDHVLGFFRVWEIPDNAIFGVLGHFSPSLPMTVGEIEYFGLPFRKDLFTRAFINERVLDKLFGVHAGYVREHFLISKSYGLYELKSDYDTQKKVRTAFDGRTDENSLWIRDGLYRLISDVLFLEDSQQAGMYHPRIGVIGEPVFDALNAEEKDAFMRLYNNYYYQRHNFFWGAEAIRKLSDVFGTTRMLCCAEDLGMLPDCVAPVLDKLRILSLEIQSMPKQSGFEFAHLDGNPYLSVATISTHDMSPLRLWWCESPERTQRFYVSMLQKQGWAPEQLPAHIAEEIIARHLYCPSMLCMLSLQDWLAMDAELRNKNPRDERINVPSDPYNRWKYRMHITIEDLLKAEKYNNKVKTMIQRSKR